MRLVKKIKIAICPDCKQELTFHEVMTRGINLSYFSCSNESCDDKYEYVRGEEEKLRAWQIDKGLIS